MINFKILFNDKEIDLNIKRNNNILYQNKKPILELYSYFDEVINEKNDDINISFDYKKITSSNCILINLMDVDSIINNGKFKKGSILWEYINSLIENIDENNISDLNTYLESFFSKVKEASIVEYNSFFDIDVVKLYNNFINIKPQIDTCVLYNKLLEMLDVLIKKKLNKTFIIFIDNNINVNIIKDYENIYLFDISKNKNSDKYNLICIDELKEINFDILLNTLEDHWPIECDKKSIMEYLNNYFNTYLNNEKVVVNNDNDLIIALLLNKIYELNQEIICDLSHISKVVQSFYSKF